MHLCAGEHWHREHSFGSVTIDSREHNIVLPELRKIVFFWAYLSVISPISLPVVARKTTVITEDDDYVIT